MIEVRIIADSVNPAGVRLTSWMLTYPRMIHSEVLTHRIFSRNSASSRAIPLQKMLAAVGEKMAVPEYWGAEQKGMQSGGEIEDTYDADLFWRRACKFAMQSAQALADEGVHKSLCNRLIEPFSHITVLATATDHSNFFKLRAHLAAMPEFQVLAYRMLDAYLKSEPQELPWGDWHIPQFGTGFPEGQTQQDKLKIATARCARISYLTFDGEHSPEKDIQLHDRLVESGHWSCFEHCAQAAEFKNVMVGMRSNFDDGMTSSHWLQYRKLFAGKENPNGYTKEEYSAILAAKPGWITL